MKYFILKGKQFFNTNPKKIHLKIHLNTTQEMIERYELITIDFDTFIHVNKIILMQKYFPAEFCLSPVNIYTMDNLVSTMFYRIKPILRIKEPKNFKINKNFQKIISNGQIIINNSVDAFLKSNNVSGYTPKKFTPPIAKFNMQLKFA
tara:strand:- start:9 stop:452 length:444 start_codon:yes stop_codon:yes gene_type:complete